MQVRIRQVSRTRRDPRQYGLHLIYVDHQIGFFQTIDEETYNQLRKEPATWTDVTSNYDKNSNSFFSELQANRLTPKLIQLLEENMYTDIAAHFKLKGEKLLRELQADLANAKLNYSIYEMEGKEVFKIEVESGEHYDFDYTLFSDTENIELPDGDKPKSTKLEKVVFSRSLREYNTKCYFGGMWFDLLFEKETQPTYLFMLRAECSDDAMKFASLIHHTLRSFNMQRDAQLPDVDLAFETTMTYDQLIEALKTIGDSHVMYQSLMPADKYTGLRNYEI